MAIGGQRVMWCGYWPISRQHGDVLLSSSHGKMCCESIIHLKKIILPYWWSNANPWLHAYKLECIHGILTLCALCYKYIARSIMRMTAFLHIELLTITRSCANTTCDFKRCGGAMKPTIRSNGIKNHLDLYQEQKHPNLIMLIVFR